MKRRIFCESLGMGNGIGINTFIRLLKWESKLLLRDLKERGYKRVGEIRVGADSIGELSCVKLLIVGEKDRGEP